MATNNVNLREYFYGEPVNMGCPECDHEPFESNAELRAHLWTHREVGAGTSISDKDRFQRCPHPDCFNSESPRKVEQALLDCHMTLHTGENRYACPHLVEWGPSCERRMCGVKAPCAICLLHHRHEVHGFDKDRGVTEHPWVEVPDSNMDIPLSVATINYGARRNGKEKAGDDHLQGEETATAEDQDSDVDAEGDDEDQCEILYSLPILSAPIINTPVPTYNAANTYAHNPNTLLGHRINPSNAPRPQRAVPYPSPYSRPHMPMTRPNTRVGPIVPVPSMSWPFPAAPAQRAVQMTDFLLYNQITAAHLRYDPVLAAFVEDPVYELQIMSYDGLRDRLLGSAGNAGQGFGAGYSR